MDQFRNYEEFWPFYVSQHLKQSTRALHFIGTSSVLVVLVAAVLVSPLLLLVAPVAGYGPSWIGHFFFEKNKPATFKYPFWSLRGDLRMYKLMLLGKMRPELARAALLRSSQAH